MKRYFIVFLIISLLLPVFCAAADTEITEETETETETVDTETETETETDAEQTETEPEESETEPEEPGVLSASVTVSGDYFIYGEDLTASLGVKGSQLRGGVVKLSYDKNMIYPVSVSHADAEGVTVYHSVSDGGVAFVFYIASSFTGEFKIADIAFKVKDGKEHDVIAVDIEEATVSDGAEETPASTQRYTFMLLSNVHTEYTEPETPTVTETETEAEPETETGTETETETETEPVTETETESESVTEAETETETENGTETETETGTETETETVTDSRTTDNTKRTPGKSSMPVIMTVIGTAVSAAAVGAVFIIRNAVKKKK